MERAKALTAEKQKKKREIFDSKGDVMCGMFSALKERTEAVIEDEIRALDGDIAREKQVIAGLEGEAGEGGVRVVAGRPAVRAMLAAAGGEVELLEATPSAGDPVPYHPSVSAADQTIAPLPEPDVPPEDFEYEELWQVARRWPDSTRLSGELNFSKYASRRTPSAVRTVTKA